MAEENSFSNSSSKRSERRRKLKPRGFILYAIYNVFSHSQQPYNARLIERRVQRLLRENGKGRISLSEIKEAMHIIFSAEPRFLEKREDGYYYPVEDDDDYDDDHDDDYEEDDHYGFCEDENKQLQQQEQKEEVVDDEDDEDDAAEEQEEEKKEKDAEDDDH